MLQNVDTLYNNSISKNDDKTTKIWMLPSLSELSPMIFNMELTHLGL